MKLTFLGTKGGIEPRTRRHRRHTSTPVTYRRKSVMIDCGEDWRGRLGGISPDAIVTHCGCQIGEADERKLGAELRAMARKRGVEVQIAHDGMVVRL